MQSSFIGFDYSQEANYYCPEDFDLNNKIIDEFKDSAKNLLISKVLSSFCKILKILIGFIMHFFLLLDISPKIKKMSV